jgi:pimeloyl-ACP methyl ester carboxylesterase
MLLAAVLATTQVLQVTTIRLPIADAETLQVTEAGAGPPVVLLPGLFGSAFSYRRVVPALADSGYRTIVIEPLGMGTSGRPAGHDYSLTTQADRVGAVLDSLHLQNAIVVAHSTSASIAMRLAIRRPELVRGILSIDGGPAEDAAMPGFRRILRFAPLLRLFATRGRMEKMVHDNFIKSSGDTSWVTPDVVRGYASGATANPGATLDAFRGMANSRERQTLAGNLSRIGVPVLVLVGGAPHSGGVGTAELAQLAAQIPVFGADTVAGAGHFLMEERPDAVIAGVRRLTAWR